jgi:hypothetical protein
MMRVWFRYSSWGGGVIMDNLPFFKAPGVPEMIEASGATLL